MTTNRKIAIAVGVLFFTATLSYGVGSALITSALEAPDDLLNPNNTQVGIGVVLEFINSAAVVCIGVLLCCGCLYWGTAVPDLKKIQ